MFARSLFSTAWLNLRQASIDQIILDYHAGAVRTVFDCSNNGFTWS